MIVVYGTTGELIKLAPVLLALRARGIMPMTACTGQQPEQIPAMLSDFGLPPPHLWLARGHRGADLTRPSQIPGWLATVSRSFASARGRMAAALREARGRRLVLVHGDTFTTVLGALMGRALRAQVAHAEAGLRSGRWRDPFPEELNRRAASGLAHVHLAPGEWALGNLRRAGTRGVLIDTGANTIVDSLELAGASEPEVPLEPGPFGLVSIHRFELLNDPRGLRAVLELLRGASARIPLLFVDHPVTAAAIAAERLDHLFGAGLRRIPRQRYFPFLALLRRSSFLFTDSGGSQEECAHLGHPCLVHRAVTERREGLGASVVLSGMDLGVARQFLQGPWRAVRPCAPAESPSERIVRSLTGLGFR